MRISPESTIRQEVETQPEVPAAPDTAAARPVPPCLLVGFTSFQDVTGLALAFDLLLAGFDQRQLPYRLVDFGRLGLAARPGAFSLLRILSTLQLLLSFCLKLRGVQSVYIVIASSKMGFLRDALMIWLSRLASRRLVLHLHGGGYRAFYASQSPWWQRLIARTLANAQAIVVLGEQLYDQFTFVPNYAQKMRIVPNGLPLDLQPMTVQPKALAPNTCVQLLYLSNLIESKGYLILLEACRMLYHDHGLHIHCDFCGNFVETTADHTAAEQTAAEHGKGTGLARAHFFTLIQNWGLADVVTYHGLVRGAQKAQLLQQAHALILPTTYPWEGQPICIIEALAFGTPVIATPHRGIPEQVIDQYNGFLVEADAHQIAAAVLRLWRDPAQYTQFSDQARRHFEANFTQHAYWERLIPIIVGPALAPDSAPASAKEWINE